jgi:hypothetical protein
MVHAAVDYLLVKGALPETNADECTADIVCYADDNASQPAKVSNTSNGARNARKPAQFSSTCMRTGSKLNLWIGDSGASCHMT